MFGILQPEAKKMNSGNSCFDCFLFSFLKNFCFLSDVLVIFLYFPVCLASRLYNLLPCALGPPGRTTEQQNMRLSCKTLLKPYKRNPNKNLLFLYHNIPCVSFHVFLYKMGGFLLIPLGRTMEHPSAQGSLTGVVLVAMRVRPRTFGSVRKTSGRPLGANNIKTYKKKKI